jgi:hypothetical protein
MKRTDGHQWFRLNLEFDIEAPDEAAAKTKGLRLSSELVERYGLEKEPIVRVEPTRATVPS